MWCETDIMASVTLMDSFQAHTSSDWMVNTFKLPYLANRKNHRCSLIDPCAYGHMTAVDTGNHYKHIHSGQVQCRFIGERDSAGTFGCFAHYEYCRPSVFISSMTHWQPLHACILDTLLAGHVWSTVLFARQCCL